MDQQTDGHINKLSKRGVGLRSTGQKTHFKNDFHLIKEVDLIRKLKDLTNLISNINEKNDHFILETLKTKKWLYVPGL